MQTLACKQAAQGGKGAITDGQTVLGQLFQKLGSMLKGTPCTCALDLSCSKQPMCWHVHLSKPDQGNATQQLARLNKGDAQDSKKLAQIRSSMYACTAPYASNRGTCVVSLSVTVVA